ncbi:hypothetical protein ABVK25_005221 [Lepraria finkii]|uniref:Uncharacterized protein n=1 Tax=Lepraria finkii TaxID=1340010 RepID=A0ABR4BF07_9LECA
MCWRPPCAADEAGVSAVEEGGGEEKEEKDEAGEKDEDDEDDEELLALIVGYIVERLLGGEPRKSGRLDESRPQSRLHLYYNIARFDSRCRKSHRVDSCRHGYLCTNHIRQDKFLSRYVRCWINMRKNTQPHCNIGAFRRVIGLISAWAQIIDASELIWMIADVIRQIDIIGLAIEERRRG